MNERVQKKKPRNFAQSIPGVAERLTARKMALAQAANTAEWTKNEGRIAELMLLK